MPEQGLALAGAPCRTPAPPRPWCHPRGPVARSLNSLLCASKLRPPRATWALERARRGRSCRQPRPGAHRASPERGRGEGPPGRPSGRPPCEHLVRPAATSVGEGDSFYLSFLPVPHPWQHFSHLLSLPVSSYEGVSGYNPWKSHFQPFSLSIQV